MGTDSGGIAETAGSLHTGAMPGPSLSPRQRALVRLVRLGLRNREIAERLAVTEGTVKTYMSALFKKAGVRNRTELALWASKRRDT
jgi:two-component system nitrate/nitrite response regulator NarP